MQYNIYLLFSFIEMQFSIIKFYTFPWLSIWVYFALEYPPPAWRPPVMVSVANSFSWIFSRILLHALRLSTYPVSSLLWRNLARMYPNRLAEFRLTATKVIRSQLGLSENNETMKNNTQKPCWTTRLTQNVRTEIINRKKSCFC